MGKPKKQTTGRRTGNRRSHFVQKLAKVVNGRSPVHVRTTAKQSTKENKTTK
jgi:ribosomal protein L32